MSPGLAEHSHVQSVRQRERRSGHGCELEMPHVSQEQAAGAGGRIERTPSNMLPERQRRGARHGGQLVMILLSAQPSDTAAQGRSTGAARSNSASKWLIVILHSERRGS